MQIKEFWEDAYNFVKFDFVFYILNYNKHIFSEDAFIKDEKQIYEQKRREFYRSLEEIKVLMQDPALYGAHFFVLVNMEDEIPQDDGPTGVTEEEELKKATNKYKDLLDFSSFPYDPASMDMIALNLKSPDEFQYFFNEFKNVFRAKINLKPKAE